MKSLVSFLPFLGLTLAACGSLDANTGTAPTLATLSGSLSQPPVDHGSGRGARRRRLAHGDAGAVQRRGGPAGPAHVPVRVHDQVRRPAAGERDEQRNADRQLVLELAPLGVFGLRQRRDAGLYGLRRSGAAGRRRRRDGPLRRGPPPSTSLGTARRACRSPSAASSRTSTRTATASSTSSRPAPAPMSTRSSRRMRSRRSRTSRARSRPTARSTTPSAISRPTATTS